MLRAVRHRSPLQIGRLLYPDPDLPGMAYGYVALVSGGLVQGDRLTQRICLEPGAQAHLTTLAATKVYRMERGAARQRIELQLAAGAVLEWWPDPLVPHRGARFRQEVEIEIDPEATLLYGDLLLPGRTGERHDYAEYRSRLTAHAPDSTVLFVDTQALAPSPPGGRALRETLPPDLPVVGSVYVLSRVPAVDRLRDALQASFGARQAGPVVEQSGPSAGQAGIGIGQGGVGAGSVAAPAALGGCSRLPAGAGLLVRFLAPDGGAGRATLAAVRRAARRELLGAGTAAVRKC